MVIAAMPGPEPDAADAVRSSDAGQDGKPGRDVEVLRPVAFAEDKGRDLKVGAGPRSQPCLAPQQAMLARKWFLTSPLSIAAARWTARPAATM